MPDKIVNHFVLADGSVARYDYDGLLNSPDLGGYVEKDGFGQVTSRNIAGMTETESGVSENLFPQAVLVANNKYVGGVDPNTGKAYLLDAQGLDTYIIEVDGYSTYNFTNARTAIVISDLDYTPVSELFTYATSINSTGGKYILFSFRPATYSVTTYSITKPTYEYTVPKDWQFKIKEKTAYKYVEGALSDGESLSIPKRTALKDGYQIVFKGFITSFTQLKLDFITAYGVVTNYIHLDNSKLTVKSNTGTATEYTHGLTIENDVALFVEFIEGDVSVSIFSNGASFKQTMQWEQISGEYTSPKVTSVETVCTYARLDSVYSCAKRGIWYFGDSYISLQNPARWAYYLKEYGYSKNVLLNGSAGGTSALAEGSMVSLSDFGTPAIIVMATGMNDGSDSSTAPANLWNNYYHKAILQAEKLGAEVVLATVPTVPSVNNEKKNAWVRASGYRYIDFAKAVGASGDGSWYSGMLSADGVHPTTQGAKALFTQVLLDLPEVMTGE